MTINNAITRFNNAPLKEVQDSVGITQFPSQNEWNHTFAGLIFQGGFAQDPAGNGANISFSIPFPKQILHINVTPTDSSGTQNVSTVDVTLSGFRIFNNHGGSVNYRWFAIGL